MQKMLNLFQILIRSSESWDAVKEFLGIHYNEDDNTVKVNVIFSALEVECDPYDFRPRARPRFSRPRPCSPITMILLLETFIPWSKCPRPRNLEQS